MSSVSRKDEMLEGLHNLGLLHLAEKEESGTCGDGKIYNTFQDGDGTAGLYLIRNQRTKNSAPVLPTKNVRKCIRAY